MGNTKKKLPTWVDERADIVVHNIEEDQVERVTELLVAARPAQHTPQHIREVHVLSETAIIMSRGKWKARKILGNCWNSFWKKRRERREKCII
jgi:hypothetical protein